MHTQTKPRHLPLNDFPTPNSPQAFKRNINHLSCFQMIPNQLELGSIYCLLGRIVKIGKNMQKKYDFLLSDGTSNVSACFLVFNQHIPDWVNELKQQTYYEFYLIPKKQFGCQEVELCIEKVFEIQDFNRLSFSIVKIMESHNRIAPDSV